MKTRLTIFLTTGAKISFEKEEEIDEEGNIKSSFEEFYNWFFLEETRCFPFPFLNKKNRNAEILLVREKISYVMFEDLGRGK